MAGQPSYFTGYWPATALAPLLPRSVIASSIVTASSVPVDLAALQTIIDLRSGEFDQAAVKAGYITPIPTTATQGYLVAQRVVRDGVVADAMRTIGWASADAKKPKDYEDAFQNALKAIQAGDRPIPNAPADPSAGGRVLPIWSGIPSPIMNATMGYARDLSLPNDF